MSQASSHQSSENFQSSPIVCFCGQRAYQLTSFIDDNFGRRFLTCANYRSIGRCNFFRWVDPLMCEHGRRVPDKLRQLRNLPGSSRERINRNGGNAENSWRFICLASLCALLGIVVGFWMKDIIKF